MTTPESIDNTVLILSLPRVLGATRPVEGANIGVSLREPLSRSIRPCQAR
jgi:hypothetical protein